MDSLNYLHIGIFLVTLLIIRFLLNFRYFLYLRKVLHKQDILLDGILKDTTEKAKRAAEKATDWIEENQLEIKKIVLNSGIGDQRKSYMESLGLGYAKEKAVSAIDNLAFLNSEIMGTGRQMLQRASGHYKIQAVKSFNPIFWIEFIVFLPKEILKYFNVDENAKIGSISIKILQVIYWIISIYFTYQKYINNV